MKIAKNKNKTILTHSSGPQTNLKQLVFLVIILRQKLLPVYTAHMLAKTK
jgi:hypothetical protein